MRRRIVEAGSLAGAAGASIASVAASICCVGPLALTLLGVNGMILAAGLKPYRWLLLGASFVLLAGAHYWIRRGAGSGSDASCPTRPGRWVYPVLWAATGLFGIAVLIQIAASIFEW